MSQKDVLQKKMNYYKNLKRKNNGKNNCLYFINYCSWNYILYFKFTNNKTKTTPREIILFFYFALTDTEFLTVPENELFDKFNSCLKD